MAGARTINSEQASIFQRMCGFDVNGFRTLLEMGVNGASSTTDLEESRKLFVEQLNVYQKYLTVLPSRQTLGQYVMPTGNPKSLTYTGIEQVLIRDEGWHGFLELPGRSLFNAMEWRFRVK